MLSADKEHVFFQGRSTKNPNESAPKTFIDKVAIKTGEKQRVYESENANIFERVSTIVDADAGKFIVLRESPSEVPQQYLVDGGAPHAADPQPGLMPDLTKRRSRAVLRRARGRVQVPGHGRRCRRTIRAGTQAAGDLLVLPARVRRARRSTTVRTARSTRTRFPNFGARSMEFFVRLGYAVVEPDAPIVGPQGQMNNNYVQRPAEQPVGGDRRARSPRRWSIARGWRSAGTATARSRR